jgi:signal peptidase I
MKKIIILCVCLGVLFWTFFFLKLTHKLEYYSISSPANMPTLRPGQMVFASSMRTPDYNDFICFKLARNKYAWIHRCIGKPGDIIEIKESKVYRNGKLLDDSYTDNDYIMTHSQENKIDGYLKQNKTELVDLNDTSYKITLSNKELKTYHLSLKKDVSAKGQLNDAIFIDFKNKGYNEDNFGPVKVPAGSYFLLGDNRHDAMDSRYIGFIKKS